ncbi:hypothetical protein EDB47_11775 [Vibrio crassostreae]|nr:hypothetical protein EDB35_11682 [Vibrio crassostreae]TCT54150.1 hypothetical protein EDB40_11436 [Vibrio crassostreae]TCU01579.1 hypothetical protein EDB47_11775 [Vibrio crassostreae]
MTLSQQLYDQLNQLDLKKTRRSKIDHLQREILFLRQWLNYCQIQSWLKKEKNIEISISQLAHCINNRWVDK